MTSERPKSGTNTHFTGRHALAALAIAAVIAAFGGAAIYAAAEGASGPPGWGGPGRAGLHGPGVSGGRGDPAPAGAVHDEFVAPDAAGGYTTERTQTDVVTAVSDGSLTANSDDGFTKNYAVTPSSPAAIAQPALNDTTTTRGTLENGTATATVNQ